MESLVKSKDLDDSLYEVILGMIEFKKKSIHTAVNSEIVSLYWNIGRVIKTELIKESFCENDLGAVEDISNELAIKCGRGYGKRNLLRMVRFYELYSDFRTVTTLSMQLTWSHLLELIAIDNNLKRNFYGKMATEHKWCVKTLKAEISSMLYERTEISNKPEETINNELKLTKVENKKSEDVAFRDSYFLDFLGMRETYYEKNLENAIFAELERFLLEMGRVYSLLGRHQRITIGETDYYMDSLFFHRELKRLILIELRLTKSIPENKGQMELYLRWLEKHEMLEGEGLPIGIVLCAHENTEEVEFYELNNANICTVEHLAQLPTKEIFREELHRAVVYSREILEQNIERGL